MKNKRLFIICAVAAVLVSAALVFAAVSHRTAADPVDTIRIAMFRDVPNRELYQQKIAERWAAGGHTSKLEFTVWVCYDELPPADCDLFCYDAITYHALLDAGLLAPLENVPEDVSFSWVTDLGENDGSVYGVPFLLCSDYLVYRRHNEEMSKAETIFDISSSLDTPLRDMAFYYYVENMLTAGSEGDIVDTDPAQLEDRFMEPLYQMASAIGKAQFAQSTFADYNGTKEYLNGDVDGLYVFSETAKDVADAAAESDIRRISLMREPIREAWPVDLISVRSSAGKEKQVLLEQLITVMTDADLQYDYITADNPYTCGMPANKEAFRRLAEESEFYRFLYDDASKETNTPDLYGPEFYQDMKPVSNAIVKELEIYLETEEALLSGNAA